MGRRLGSWLAVLLTVQGVGAAPAGVERFLDVSVYRLRVTWTANEHWRRPDGTSTVIRDLDLVGTVNYRLLKDQDTNPDNYMWVVAPDSKPTGQITIAFAERRLNHNDDGTETWAQQSFQCGSAPVAGEARADMEVAPRSYRVFGFCESGPGSLTLSSSAGFKQTMEAATVLSTDLALPTHDDIGPLPAAGLIVRSQPHTADKALPFGIVKGLTVRWTLEPWDVEPLRDPQMDVAEHAWLPEPGKSCAVTIKWKGTAHEVRATLSGISHEPGTCLNSASTDTGPDLYLRNDGGWKVVREGQAPNEQYVAILSRPAGSSATLPVFSDDYGGWARLAISVEIEGAVKSAQAPTGRSSMMVPWDANENHVPDRWEEDHGVADLPASTDDDPTPTGNGYAGDGLTIYEEYRGFMEDGQHLRCDPRVKDVFFSDQTATASTAAGATNACAKDGLARFEQVTKLRVHGKLTAAELGPTRVINRNHNEGAHVVDQHGVPIIVNADAGDSEARTVAPGAPIGPPKQSSVVVLVPPLRRALEDGVLGSSKYTERVDGFISRIAHELCHCVGVRHHGDNILYVLWRFKRGGDGVDQLWEQAYTDSKFTEPKGAEVRIRAVNDADNREVTPDNVATMHVGSWDEARQAYMLLVAGPHSEYSGMAECVMRYDDANAYWTDGAPTVRFLPDPGKYLPQRALCDSAAGTAFNAADHQPRPRYGAASRGNCAQQLVVNDAYTPH